MLKIGSSGNGDAEIVEPAAVEADPAGRGIVDDPGGGDLPARVFAGSRSGVVTGQGE